MSTSSQEESALLAHLRDRFGVGPENLATETLAFLLNSYPAAGASFVEHCAQFGGVASKIDRFITQVRSASDDQAIPDLVGLSDGRGTLVVEVKFQAALTEHQPTTYAQGLRDGGTGGLLLFLVPASRETHVWEELRRRCLKQGWKLEGESESPRAASIGNVRMGLTTWSAVLTTLGNAVSTLADQRAFYELRQLRSLCEYEDRQIFEPLSMLDLDRRIPRRIMEYRDLIYDAVEKSGNDVPIETTGLQRFASGGATGRYFWFHGWESSLALNWRLWARAEHQSPIWLHIHDRRYVPADTIAQGLRASGVTIENDGRSICIGLPANEDRDKVLEAITQQMRAIAGLLPPGPGRVSPMPSGINTDQDSV